MHKFDSFNNNQKLFKYDKRRNNCLSKQTNEVMVSIDKHLVQHTEEVTKQVIASEEKILQQFS